MMVWRIPAEQFSSSNDPCYCLRVDWVHREPEDFHIILIIVTTTIIIALSSIVGKNNLLNFMFSPQVSILYIYFSPSFGRFLNTFLKRAITGFFVDNSNKMVLKPSFCVFSYTKYVWKP